MQGTHPRQTIMPKRNNTVHAVMLAIAFVASPVALAWDPPVGVPMPSFGINETVASEHGSDSFYTHYVDQNHGSATDSNNTFGTPSKPRRTIPSSLSAGSVVLVSGTYSHTSGGVTPINGSGTASNPVFVRGTNGARFIHGTQFKGQYVIVENFEFDGANPLFTENAPHHYALRHSEVHSCGGPAIQISAWDNSAMSNIVL